jgi:hypothetical protein
MKRTPRSHADPRLSNLIYLGGVTRTEYDLWRSRVPWWAFWERIFPSVAQIRRRAAA